MSFNINIEGLAKKNWIRVLTVVISVGTAALYTNAKLRRTELRYEECLEDSRLQDKKMMQMQRDIVGLKSNMLVLSLADDNFPNPKWIKSVDLMMLQLNKAFEDVYLKPQGLKRADYIGNYDYDIWPDDIAAQFRNGDKLVLRADTPMTFYEYIQIDSLKEPEKIKVVKYPIRVNGTVVGVGGYVELNHDGEDK